MTRTTQTNSPDGWRMDEIFRETETPYDEELFRLQFIKDLRCYIPKDRCEEYVEWVSKRFDELIPKTTNTRDTRPDNSPLFKFGVGDWITDDNGHTYKVVGLGTFVSWYTLENTQGLTLHVSADHVDYYFRLWNINDAKDGDILSDSSSVFVFKKGVGLETDEGPRVIVHCSLGNKGDFSTEHIRCIIIENEVRPATQAQVKKLLEAAEKCGYSWDGFANKLVSLPSEEAKVEEPEGSKNHSANRELIADISERFLYGRLYVTVKGTSITGRVVDIRGEGDDTEVKLDNLSSNSDGKDGYGGLWLNVKEVTPHLRSMTSMTDDEMEEYDSFNTPRIRKVWLNENMFDFRGLIMGGSACILK